MKEVIQIQDQFYVKATSTYADDQTRVLKNDHTFAVFDRYGDIQSIGPGKQGIYHEGTRFLSKLQLNLDNDIRPLLLNSTIREDNTLFTVELTNPSVDLDGNYVVPGDTLHISRSKFLWEGTCYERIVIRNFERSQVDMAFRIEFGADFKDVYEVRGIHRAKRGRYLKPCVDDACVVLAYEGLDGVTRRTKLELSPAPQELDESVARYSITLDPKESATFFVTISYEYDETLPPVSSYDAALQETARSLDMSRSRYATVSTSNELFDDWLKRSVSDLDMMLAQVSGVTYPFAGVPWFTAPFGRDGIITAWECLWINPEITRGVLLFLASTQAREVVMERDAEPGKILHEMRQGEMAALGEIPFGLYYGSADATPLFVMLAWAYYERTGDRDLIASIWENIELALQWIDKYGDLDGDGFVEYERQCPNGLINQGWKDSTDSIFHADGSIAKGPIALCEVQAYVYGAKRSAARLAGALGHAEKAVLLFREASLLQKSFEATFWVEELSTYALALDGDKRLCRVRTSNAGHTLFTGIASQQRAARIAQSLMSDEFYNGWGIRTVPDSEVAYNPISYHNGSVWPHDNAMIASGFADYGFKNKAVRILSGIFGASVYLDLHRMPELFCGFPQQPGQGPTLYPVANSPQSWAAASTFLLLQACLGMKIDAPKSQLLFTHPALPKELQEVTISNLKIGDATVNLKFERHDRDVGVIVDSITGDLNVMITK